ncbi:MAG: lanthionine synthetase LanC family protein [Bryobacteraceae bacterium]
MSIDGELVMPPEVDIFSVRELAPDVRANIDAADEDYAVTRRRSREPSRIVDKDSADLLAMFRAPARIVDAVLSFAGSRGLDAEATLEHAYPLLHHLYHARVLVPPGDKGAAPLQRELGVGSVVEGFRLLRSVQALEDNEVFLGRSAAGQYAAVKFYAKADERTTSALEHEAGMSRRIQHKCVPEVYSLARTDSGIALVTEWVFGLDSTNAAATLRQRATLNQRPLLALCSDIATAFAGVHESGVLHGDVHPKNVLVEGGGTVRLIDFGLAQPIEKTGDSGPRGGVAFYFDPEFAEGQLSHKQAILSAAGEQYSVASLLYQLWTGAYYMDWSLEREALLRQIVEVDPAAFETRNVPAWPALEAVLGRALHKRPDLRFPSMRAFADALSGLLPEADARDRNAAFRHKERAKEKELLDRTLQRLALGGPALRDGLADAPLSSINYGAAGVAYSIYNIARRRADPKLLALADVWIQRAFASSPRENAFYRPEIEIDRDKVGEVSLFHSMSGLYCVRALISIAMGDLNGANTAIQSFVGRSRGPCKSLDLTLGKASLLIGCAELVEAMPVPWFVNIDLVRSRGDELAEELRAPIKSQRLATSTKVTMLGIAHGWAGVIFSLLRWARANGGNVDAALMGALDELAELAEPHGAGLRWPLHNSTNASPSYMEGWCNGTAGYTMLFALAHDMLRTTRYGDLAERAAIGAWGAETRLGTLCCGLGGIGYALLAAYRLTGSELWLERARMTTRRAAADSSKNFLRDSLYKGAVGVALLAEDLKYPDSAAMPLFEPTR